MKNEHITIRNQKLFCLHCGGEHALPFPIETKLFIKKIKSFTGLHCDCLPVWKEPQANSDWSIQERMNFWLSHGERGLSSMVIFENLSGRGAIDGKKFNDQAHPSDPDDFRRCYALLKLIPEWKNSLYKLKTISTAWLNLVDNWDKLTELMEDQLKTGKTNEMFELMESLTLDSCQ